MSADGPPPPRLRLRHTRRGWVVGVLAALSTGAAVQVAQFAAADDTPRACPALTTTVAGDKDGEPGTQTPADGSAEPVADGSVAVPEGEVSTVPQHDPADAKADD